MPIERNVSGGNGNFVNEPGEYLVCVTEASMKKTKTPPPRDMRVVTFQTMEEKEIRAYFVRDVTFHTSAMEQLKLACGLKVNDHPDQLMGKTCGILVEAGRPTDEGRVFMQIVGYGPESQVGNKPAGDDFQKSEDVPF